MKLRIVLVCQYYHPEVGGLERSTHRLARWFRSAGHDVVVLAPRLSGTAAREVLEGVPIIRPAGDHDAPFTHGSECGELIRHSDAVVCFGVVEPDKQAIWSPVLAASRPVRLLKIGSSGDLALKRTHPGAINAFDGILCLNAEIAADASAMGVPPERLHHIRNGIDLEEWRGEIPSPSDARRELNISPGAFVVAGIARFVRRKRLSSLVRGFGQFAATTNGKPVLLLHGSDFQRRESEEAELRREAARLAHLDIRFIGPEIPSRLSLAASDVSVALGEREGAPNTILESLASGVPVIASDIAGHRVFLEGAGCGVLCREPIELLLADNLSRLAGDVRLHRAMAGAALRAAEKFDIAKAGADYLNVVRATADRRVTQD